MLGILLGASLASMGLVSLAQRRRRNPGTQPMVFSRVEKETWRMPPLAALTKPAWSTTRTIGMLTLRLYLFLAVVLLVVKIVQMALGQ